MWPATTLGEVTDTGQYGLNAAALKEGGGVRFIRITDIDASGQLGGASPAYVDVTLPDLGRYMLSPGDLLIARSGATAGKSLLFRGLPESAVFAGYLIRFKARVDRVLPEYLGHFLQSPMYWSFIRKTARAVAQPNVNARELASLPVPLPPLPEQQRIVELLSRAESIVRMRREAEQKATELIPALFLDMFGDPGTNPKGWDVTRIEDCCTLVRGSSPRPQGDARYFGGPVPRLMIADITRDGIYVTPRIDSLTPAGAERSRPMNRGDVVMAVSGACGLPAILAVDACIHDGFVGFRALSEKVRPEYLYTFLAVMREQTKMQAVGATFQNLKTDQIREWRVPIPPIHSQDSFVDRAKNLRQLRDDMAEGLRVAELAFQSLLAGVFGE